MEFEKGSSTSYQDLSENVNNIDLKEVVEKYLKYWKWFLLSIVLGIIISFLYLNFQKSIYQANSTIKIKNENAGDNSALSAFQDLGVIPANNQVVEDEMEILLSKDLIAEVIKSLNFNVQYFTNQNYISKFLDNTFSFNTEFYENELYKDSPLEINFLLKDSELYEVNSEFIIFINSLNNFTFIDSKNSVEKRYAFGEKVTTNFGDIILIPKVDLKASNLIGEKILVKISSILGLSNAYSETLNIEPISEFSSILNLKFTSPKKEKAEDFLRELVKKYNDRAIKLKDALTKSTSEFVDKRLTIISDDLENIDLNVESIKTRYRLSDVASTTGLNMQTGQEVENQIVQANAQLEKIGYIKDYVSTKGENELIPVDVGVADNNVSSSVSQYNQLVMQKKRLLENSTEKNPIVINVNKQLKDLKSNINQGLNNLESSQKISLDALKRQDALINSRIYSAPRQERQYRDIQRQQQIKEELYLYLLQKREETAITLGVADPNAKIVDSATSLPDPVSPNKLFTYIGFLIVSLFVPFLIFYLIELFDKTIHSREQVEKVLTNVPVIGDIPKIESKNNYLIKKDDYSGVAEAFRILRTNLNFLSPFSNSKKGKTIFITSTIAHEGKSLVSSNLATALAHAGKRTILLGMDIRAPKIKPYLGVKSKNGITSYIVNSDLTPEKIIVNVPNIDNLSIITSGELAPNPAELLMESRVGELFDFVKENYEYIIVDTAAYSKVTDTLLISKYADAFIYVVRANYLDIRALKYIKSLYRERKLPNLSVLVNGIDYKKVYGYGYGYGYGKNFEDYKKKPWWKFA